jgi:hypothetical protein
MQKLSGQLYSRQKYYFARGNKKNIRHNREAYKFNFATINNTDSYMVY